MLIGMGLENLHQAAAASLLKLVRSKGSIEEVEEELLNFSRDIEVQFGMTEDEAGVVKRDLAFQTMFMVGSRSFSHFLNVLERWVDLFFVKRERVLIAGVQISTPPTKSNKFLNLPSRTTPHPLQILGQKFPIPSNSP